VAINAPELCMASGPVKAIADLEARLLDRGVECKRIQIRVAAHSAMLDPILDELERFCRTITLRPPSIPFVSNLTGTWITEREAMVPAYWVRHRRGTVQVAAGMGTLLAGAEQVFLGVCPGRTLSSLARQQTVKGVTAFPTTRHPREHESDVEALLRAVGGLW